MRKFKRLTAGLATGLLIGTLPQVAPLGVHEIAARAAITSSGTEDCEQTYSVSSGSGSAAAYQSGNTCFIAFKNTGSVNTIAVMSWTVPSGVQTVDVLVVGGGGGGGAHVGAGGGAGGLISLTDESVSGSSVAIEVGAGGGGADSQVGSDISRSSGTTGVAYSGKASKFGSNTADGGGRGGFWWNTNGSAEDDSNGAAASGGSGGGAVERSTGTTAGGTASGNGTGNNGGQAGGGGSPDASGYITGGGGGASAVGQSANHLTLKSGDGGAGQSVSWISSAAATALTIGEISGGNVYFAGGGGGGFHDINATGGAGDGGLGGGGDGAGPSSTATNLRVIGSDGTATTGGGGGGSGAASTGTNHSTGGDGGSGVVLVSFVVPTTPTISTAPSSSAVDAGRTASFSVTSSVSDGGTLSYQWQQSTDSGSTWSNVSGATSASYTTPTLDATDSGDQFRVVVRNTLGGNYAETTSSTATLTVSRVSQTVTWTQPTSLVLANSGDSATVASTSGDGSISYSVVSAGTTGCAINSSTGVLTFSGTGTCSVKADAAQTNTYTAASATVSVTISQGTIAVSGPSSKVGTSSSSFTSVCTSSCDVTGFASADEVLVVVNESDGSALAGEVKLGSTTGLTQSLTGYQSDATQSGLYELAFEGTPSEVNAALETLQYKSPSGGGDETIQISASLSGATYSTDTGHYYEVVNVGSAVAWEDARCRAKYGDSSAHDNSAGLTQTDDECTNTGSRRTFNGLNGYLANITSLDEHNFLRTKLNDVGWIGGADLDTEGTFQWVDGPEAGQTFFIAGTSTRRTTNTIDGVSQFNYFSNGEPNNSGGAEDFVEFGFGSNGVGSSWNDCQNGCSRPRFVIEYGGDGGTVLKQASNTFDVGAPTAPLQVTGLSVTTGDTKLTLSWSAPGSGGSAITDYVIEQSTDGGSTWSTLSDGTSTATSYVVTGLTNGSSYSFRVSAKNVIGTGTASSTASGTPAVVTSSSRTSTKKAEPVVVTPVVTPTRPTVRLPFPTATPPRPTVLSAPVKSSTSVSTPVDRLVSRVGGVPAPVSTTSSGDDELSVLTSSMRLSLKMSLPGTVSTPSDDVTPELTIKPGARAAVSGSGLLPNTTVQVWLPNVSDRELGRLAVNTDGELTGELSLSSTASEDPLPIGRQTMQVTGYDADGNQTVVEMPVNIAQGPPTPESNREEGALPDLSPGQSLATSAGVPTTVSVTPFAEQRVVAVDGGDWSLSVAVADANGEVGGTSEEPLIRMTQSGQGLVTGDGFQPGTVASLWMFSEPTMLGTVTVLEDGSFNAEFLVDTQFLPVGEHTLQVQGVGTDGFIKAANLGVLVDAAPAPTTADSALSMIWWILAAVILVALVIVLLVARRRRNQA